MTRSRETGDVGYRAYKKNFLINGDMSVWQRGDGPFAGSDGFNTDRWFASSSSGTFTRAKYAAAGRESVLSVQGNQAYIGIRQKIEGAYDMRGMDVVFSMSALITSLDAPDPVLTFQFFREDNSASASAQVTQAITMPVSAQYQVISAAVTLPELTDDTAAVYLTVSVEFSRAVATDVAVLVDWVQLEEGSSATAFEYVSPAQNLAECQRYYEKSYSQGVNPAALNQAGGAVVRVANGTSDVSNQWGLFMPVKFKVEKRASPTLTLYDFQNAAIGSVYNAVTGGHYDATPNMIGTGGFNIHNTTVVFADQAHYGHWTADAEL